MAQQFRAQPQIKTRFSILIFVKGVEQPLVFYFTNPQKEYEDLKLAMKTPNVIIEKETIGPIKKFCILSNNILGVFIQDEQYPQS